MTGQVRVVLAVTLGFTTLSLTAPTVHSSSAGTTSTAVRRVDPGPPALGHAGAPDTADTPDRRPTVGITAGPTGSGDRTPIEDGRSSWPGRSTSPEWNGPPVGPTDGLADSSPGSVAPAPDAEEDGAPDDAGLPPLADQCPQASPAARHLAPGAGRTIALTFDDGPGPYTGAVLDVLAAEGVHATFFVVGREVESDPAAVARAAAEGHLIGNHTWDHAYPRAMRDGWTVDYLRDQLSRTDAAVAAATGQPTCFFRPPGGFTPPSVKVAGSQLREQVWLWSVDPRDWAVQGTHDPEPREAAAQTEQIVAAATSGDIRPHPVLLLHDGGGYRGATVAALPRIIAFYRDLGFQFVRLDGRS